MTPYKELNTSTQPRNPDESSVKIHWCVDMYRSHTGHQTTTWKIRMRPQTGSVTACLIKGCRDPVLWGGPQADAISPGSQHRTSSICRVLFKLEDDVEEQHDEDAEDHGEEAEGKDDGSTHATVVADLAETTKPQGK